MRLNGWQRIGVVASAVWLPIGFVIGKQAADQVMYWNGYYVEAWAVLLLWTLLPIPAGWLAACLAIFVSRWVRRGFAR